MRRQSPSGSCKANFMSIVADSSVIRAPRLIYDGATVRIVETLDHSGVYSLYLMIFENNSAIY